MHEKAYRDVKWRSHFGGGGGPTMSILRSRTT
jgi:hypothetical protein